jgi:superkiller protein 3
LNLECISSGRILASYHVYLKDYEPASEISRSTIESLNRLREDTGVLLYAPEISLFITLGQSLIYYQAPKHHPQACILFDAVLSKKPTSVEALIGKSRIALEKDEVGDAVELTAKALEVDPSNVEAKMEHAWALVLTGKDHDGKTELQETLHLVDGRDPQSRDLVAEIWWRIGKCLWDEGNCLRFLTNNRNRRRP